MNADDAARMLKCLESQGWRCTRGDTYRLAVLHPNGDVSTILPNLRMRRPEDDGVAKFVNDSIRDCLGEP